jgi:predicted transport protein
LEQRANLILLQVKKRIGDFSATVEEEMLSDPALLIQRVEQNIRSLINDTLYDTFGENWWDSDNAVPQDIKNDVNNKIKREKARKPYISDEEWRLPVRKLEHLNIMDYPKIILKNWNIFEDFFGTKGQVDKYFDGFSSIRNHIDHLRTIDPVERKFGETSIEWILRCTQKKAEVDEGTKNKGQSAIGNQRVQRQPKTVEQHLESASKELQKLFGDLNSGIMEIAPDVIRYTTFAEIIYKTSVIFVASAVQPHKNCVRCILRTEEDKIKDPKNITHKIPRTHGYGI